MIQQLEREIYIDLGFGHSIATRGELRFDDDGVANLDSIPIELD
jgi:hypothetical protein